MLANGVHILKIDQSEMYLQKLKESLSNPWATMKLQQQLQFDEEEVVKAITQPPTYLPPTHPPISHPPSGTLEIFRGGWVL